MKVFCLWPFAGKEKDRAWQASILPPTRCWVRASSPAQARERLQMATLIATKVEKSGPIRPVVTSPWVDPALTECVEDEPGFSVPAGIIVTAGGRTLDLPPNEVTESKL
jgi:hypothetical protein